MNSDTKYKVGDMAMKVGDPSLIYKIIGIERRKVNVGPPRYTVRLVGSSKFTYCDFMVYCQDLDHVTTMLTPMGKAIYGE